MKRTWPQLSGCLAVIALAACVATERAASPSGAVRPADSDTPPLQRVIVTESVLSVLGRSVPVFHAEVENGSPVLRGQRNERLRVELVNRSSLPISMHPHGLILPSSQDGVPYITQLPVQPGASFIYDFVPVQMGSYFLHSHYGWELQDQLVMPFILDDSADRSADAKEVIMLLTDLTFRSPPEIFAELRTPKPGESMPGMKPGESMPGMKPGMAMKADLTDVDYDAVLANRRPIAAAEVVQVSPGSRVRLRLINGSGASNFVIDLGGLRGRAVAVDGEPIHPVELERVELAVAQRLDLLIEVPESFESAAIVAQAEGTTLHAAIIVAAPGASLPQLPDRAKEASGAMGVGYTQERLLRALSPLPKRAVDRSIEVNLTGDMSKYRWDLNGVAWADAPPMTVKEGERVELVFTNKTMMSHSMHLHGHRFQVMEIDGQPLDGAYRDTILVMPKSTVKVQFDADNPGLWMMHCHLLWHEAAGMMGIVEYEGYPKPSWYKQVDSFNEPSSLPR